MSLTIKQLEEMQASGKIRGFSAQTPVKRKDNSVSKKKAEKIKAWIELQLQAWCNAHRLELKKEFMFDPERLWRSDWAIPLKKLSFEYEGLSSKKNGHTTKKGYTSNTDKYNELSAQGWKVFRYTYMNYKQLINDLNKLV